MAGDLLGTPGYMSPEQARGEVVDWRTDVFALGCLIMPMFIIGSLSAFMSQPVRHSPWAMVLLHVVPVALLLALELSGVLPRSFELAGGKLVITPYTVDLSALTLVLVFVLSFAVQVGSTFDIQHGFRQAQEAAQNRIHAQTWHLKQLLPRSGKLDTGPVPKQ